jgi:hypothetical protein
VMVFPATLNTVRSPGGFNGMLTAIIGDATEG